MHMQCRTAVLQSGFSRRQRRRLASALGLTLMAGLLPPAATRAGEHAQPPDYQVKAAFVQKFLGYVEWPPQAFATPRTPLRIAVIGDDEMARALRALLPERLAQSDREVTLRVVDADDALEGVQLLYIGHAARAHIAAYAQLAQQRAMLLVTDADNALRDGSMINFLRVQDRVRFEVSLETVKRAGLHISARLLAVAYRVEKGSL